MMATNHMLTGAIIGTLLPSPLAVPLAFASHFILDSLPHYGDDNHTHLRFLLVVLSDAVLCTVFLSILLVQQPNEWQWASIGAISAASPDFMWLSHWIRELRHQPKRVYGTVVHFHKNIQWGERWYFAPIELLWGISAVTVLVNLAKS